MIELMVVISIIAVLSMLGAPSLTDWIRSTRVRTTADSLQNGLRLAQSEAIRQSRQVVFVFTNLAPTGVVNVAASANGINWYGQTVPLMSSGEAPSFVRGGNMADITSGVAVNTGGQTAVCFDSAGRLMANATPGPPNAVCNVAGVNSTFDVALATNPASAKKLRVTVSVGGRIRMCDLDKTLAASPDGC